MTRTIGLYSINGIAGRGAMGTVYDAWDSANERRVAIKVIDLGKADSDDMQHELQRFHREAEIAQGLVHPNIVQTFDAGESAHEAYIVMEFIEGPSLKSVMDAGRRFTLTEAVGIAESVLGGLSYSHSRGVIHRDIKPANLMVTAEGAIKIADFGVARLEGSNMTQTGMMIGTPAYMSPEQFMCEPIDARSDVYAVGVLLFQMLTGERPFEGSMSSIMYKALNTTPPKPSALALQVPAALDEVVARAMARNPADRFPSAAAFAQALTQPVDDMTVIRRPGPTPARQVSSAGRPDPALVTTREETTGRRQLADIPAYTPPPEISVPVTMKSRVASVARGLLLFVLLAGAALVAFDLYLGQPIGTLPSIENLTHAPPMPGRPAIRR